MITRLIQKCSCFNLFVTKFSSQNIRSRDDMNVSAQAGWYLQITSAVLTAFSKQNSLYFLII